MRVDPGLRGSETLLVAGSSLLFLLLTVDVRSDGLVTHLDQSIVGSVAASEGGPQWALTAAGVGAAGVSGAVVAITTLVCAHRLWRLWPIALTALNLAVAGIFVRVVKTVTGRAGPPTSTTSPEYAGYFPSGHTATAVVCFGTAAFLATVLLRPGLGDPRTTGWRSGWDKVAMIAVGLGLVVGLTVGLSTVVTGNHWPSDIAGGLLVGAVVLVVGFAAARALVGRQAAVRS